MKPRAAWHPWAMLAPTLAVLAIFFIFPLVVAARSSVFSWDLLTPPAYVGSANYASLFASGELTRVLGATLAFSALVVVGSVSFGLALALALSGPGRWVAFVRGAVFSAYVVSWVAVALLWSWMLDPDAGLVASVFRALRLPHIAFLSDPAAALPTVAVVTVWKITGYAMVIFIVGLQDVPPSVLEAASLDGAGALARFRYVIWPLLRPTAAFVATTSLIASFQAFDVVRVMTQGGPVHATTFFVYAIYEQVFLDLRVGRASALTVVFFVVLFSLSLVQLAVWRGRGARAGSER